MLGALDTGLLWGNLGVSLLVVVAGAALVPALSLPDALVAILLGCVIGNLMLAVAGAIGADARVPGMVLMRAPLGRRGSYLPTGMNVLQGIGWSMFELLIIATAAAALSDELFGFRAQWLWTLAFGVVRARPRAARADRVRPPLRPPDRRLGGPVRASSTSPGGHSTAPTWVRSGTHLARAASRSGREPTSSSAITVSWVPYAADYTRFSKTSRGRPRERASATSFPDAWLLALGVVLVLSRDLSDPAALPTRSSPGDSPRSSRSSRCS